MHVTILFTVRRSRIKEIQDVAEVAKMASEFRINPFFVSCISYSFRCDYRISEMVELASKIR